MDGLHCAFIGRVVGQGADLRYTSNGTPLVNATLLVQDSKAGDGEGQFVRVGHFGDDAEQLVDQLTKGVECYSEGKLKLNTWQTSDGTPRSGLNVTAWKLEVIGQIGRRAARPARTGALLSSRQSTSERVA
jgi:single-stranded DNA-binding protein